MLARIVNNTLGNLAVALAMLFSGIQIWWAVEALQTARQTEAAANRPAASEFTLPGSF